MIADTAAVALRWWNELQPHDLAGRGRTGDRAALARLRHAAMIMDAVMEPATLDLCRRLGARADDELERVALVAGVLAHVREDDRRQPVARQIGKASMAPDGQAAVSELRFRRLLQADTPDAQLTAFRRMAALAGHRLNVGDLAESLLDWTDRRRRRWIYDYYNAGPSGPVAPAISAEGPSP